MATYFHGSSNNTGSEIHSSSSSSSSSSAAAEGTLQTLHLMNNATYVPYSHGPHHPTLNNMIFLNNPHALNLANISHAPPLQNQQHHHHVIHGVTNILGSTDDSDDQTLPSLFGNHDITTAFHGFSTAAPRVGYNLWGPVIDQRSPTTASPSGNTGVGGGPGGYRQNIQQGLSLSLSSDQTTHRSVSGEINVPAGHTQLSGIVNSHSSASNGVILGSKYLKAAQELLDEVVNVGKGIYKDEKFAGVNNKEKMKANRESSTCGDGDGENIGGKQGGELNTAQRQELLMKKSKLVNMLDEVEQRYRQYHQQMQIIISSFEQAAGYGAAKSYTALALKTISKQFRCLKDAISSQIKATSKTLGEDDCLGVKVEAGSRLRYVDHHLRQQRALQQLGMFQPNAWRPQRGLPERAVSILRAWLFEHFLHPYPKDSDKVMLAKQTGLARGQVSNWFINARVRLWKPMVEEMYMEEIKEQEQANNSDNNRSKESNKELVSTTANVTPESAGENKLDHLINNVLQQQSRQESFNNNSRNNTTSPTEISTNSSLSPVAGSGSFQSHSAFHLVGSSDMQRSSEMQNSPSSILSMDMEMKHRDLNNRDSLTTKFGNIIDQRNHKDGYPLNGNHGFGVFSMDDIGNRFNVTDQQLASTRFHGNGVSLTLGLPHNDQNLSISAGTHDQHGFLSHLGRRLEMETDNGNEFCAAINSTTPSSNSAGIGYESIDIQNRKRFAAQLLHDFVAS